MEPQMNWYMFQYFSNLSQNFKEKGLNNGTPNDLVNVPTFQRPVNKFQAKSR